MTPHTATTDADREKAREAAIAYSREHAEAGSRGALECAFIAGADFRLSQGADQTTPDLTPERIAELRRTAEAADPSPLQCIHEEQTDGRGFTLHFTTLILGVRTLARAADTAQNRADFERAAAGYNALPALLAEVERLRADRAKLQAFKDWVHAYLDSHGVPHHPPGTHGAEGCRIGDRMDWLMEKLNAALAAAALASPEAQC